MVSKTGINLGAAIHKTLAAQRQRFDTLKANASYYQLGCGDWLSVELQFVSRTQAANSNIIQNKNVLGNVNLMYRYTWRLILIKNMFCSTNEFCNSGSLLVIIINIFITSSLRYYHCLIYDWHLYYKVYHNVQMTYLNVQTYSVRFQDVWILKV